MTNARPAADPEIDEWLRDATRGDEGVKMRHLRAPERLRLLLEELGVEPSTSP